MICYVDSSVLLRLVLAEAGPLVEWPGITVAVSSALCEVECLRTIDRRHLRGALSAGERAEAVRRVRVLLDELTVAPLEERVLRRASETFGSPLGTLDALHLATALAWRDGNDPELAFATHDAELGQAARLFGFEVIGG